ncbi:Phage Mu protein F like protein [Candidatus Anstonella stagnisolia]|nr:Phage Mu protein F like protein [Candidatus Anstonella stagnisolia]
MRITVPSLDVGTYFFQNPSVTPNTASDTPSISDLESTYWTNPLVHKGVNLRANRIIGEGFKIQPSDHPDAVQGIAEEAAKRCEDFYKKIGGLSFSKQSVVNALVAGNEWSECIYNQLDPKSLVHCAHGDFRTIDFRRNFINNKILFDEHGKPLAYWQFIDDLSQLYHTLSIFYGDIEPYENMQAAKARLLNTQHRIIKDKDGNEIAVSMAKPNYMFLKQDEIVHLSFNNLNDNYYGTSMLIPAWNALTHLQQVMYATAEAINDMGYPKPIIYVGDDKHAPNEAMTTLAETAVKDPLRKESFVLPYYCKMEYLQPSGMGNGNIGDYPQWFVTAVAMGLRIPRELLTGEGEANRACYVADTRVLTEDGFKNYEEVQSQEKIAIYDVEKDEMKFEKPEGLFVYDVDEELIFIEGMHSDIGITKDHKVFYTTDPDKNWKIGKAEDLLQYENVCVRDAPANWKGVPIKEFVIPASHYEGNTKFCSNSKIPQINVEIDTWLKFLGIYLSEGCTYSKAKEKPYGKNSHRYMVRLCQHKDSVFTKDIDDEIMSAMPINCQRQLSKEGMVSWTYTRKNLWEYFFNSGNFFSSNKFIPKDIKCLPQEKLEILIDWMLKGDGSRQSDDCWSYTTVSVQLAEDLQEIALKCGFRVKKSVHYEAGYRGNRKKAWRVSINKKMNFQYIRRSNIKVKHYVGKVFSFQVSSRFYITERNGKIAIQGNTAVQAGTDFDIDIQADRRRLEEYHLEIFNLYLKTHGYEVNSKGRSIYLPKLVYPESVSEDEMMKRKMALDAYQAGLMKFGEARKELKLPEDKDAQRDGKYVDEIKAETQPALPAGTPIGGTPIAMNQDELGQPQAENQTAQNLPNPAPEEDNQSATVTAQHRLFSKDRLARLNKEFNTKDVNFRQVAQEDVGKKIVSVSETFAKRIRDAIVNMEAEGKSLEDIMSAIKKIGDLTDAQAKLIFETEQTNLVESARHQSAQKQGVKFKKWIAVNDERTSDVCRALHGKVVPVGEDFKVTYKDEQGRTQKWSGQQPAAHPACRSHLEYGETARFAQEKIYLKEGEKPPAGTQAYQGAKGGKYYIGNPRQAGQNIAPAARRQAQAPAPKQPTTPEPPPKGNKGNGKSDRSKLPSGVKDLPEEAHPDEIKAMEGKLKEMLASSYGSGTTNDIEEVGFMLSDGSMPKMGHGGRDNDHKIAAAALPEKYRVQNDPLANLKRFLYLTGAIRTQFYGDKSKGGGYSGLNFLKAPNEKQMAVLKKLFSSGKAKLPIYSDMDIPEPEENIPTQSKEFKSFEEWAKWADEMGQVHEEDVGKPQEVRAILDRFMRHSENQGAEIHFNDENEIKLVLEHGHYGLISAGRNPNSPADKNLSIEQLKQRSQRLKADLITKGYMFTPVIGKYGEIEDSFLIMAHDPDEKDLAELGMKYNQDSVILVREKKNQMIYTSGENINRKVIGLGYTPVGQDAADYYTEITLANGKKIRFTLGFDFSKQEGSQEEKQGG